MSTAPPDQGPIGQNATLNGRHILVTGGARGIGAASARAFVAEGAQVAICDVIDDLGEQVAKEATASGPGSAHYFHCDISKADEVDRVFAAAVDTLGSLDVLANIAGVERGGPAETASVDDYRFMFDVNVLGTILTNQAAFRAMRETGGHIINVGSDAGLAGYGGLSVYGATKGAVMAWTRNAALEWGRYGIRVNSLVPAIWTPMYQTHRDRMSPDELAEHDAKMAASIRIGGKLGDPDRDLAPVMVFLAGRGSGFITGQLVMVNGGTGMGR